MSLNLLSKECEIDALRSIHEYVVGKVTYEEIEAYTHNYDLFIEYVEILEKIDYMQKRSPLIGTTIYPWNSIGNMASYEKLLFDRMDYREELKTAENQMGSENDIIKSLSECCIYCIDLENMQEYNRMKPYMGYIEQIILEEARFLENVSCITSSFYGTMQEEIDALLKERIYLYLKEKVLNLKEAIIGEMIKKNHIMDHFWRKGDESKELFKYVSVIGNKIDEISTEDRKIDQRKALQILRQEEINIKHVKMRNPKIRKDLIELLIMVENYIEGKNPIIKDPSPIELPFPQKTYTNRRNMVY